MFVQVLPLMQRATRVTLSNVPLFVTDEFLSRELSRHGKIISPMKMLLCGFNSPLMKHVVSHRRHMYMILGPGEAAETPTSPPVVAGCGVTSAELGSAAVVTPTDGACGRGAECGFLAAYHRTAHNGTRSCHV